MTKETETFTYYRTKDGIVNLNATLQDIQQLTHPGIEFPVVEFHTHRYPEKYTLDSATLLAKEALANLLHYLEQCNFSIKVGDCIQYSGVLCSALLCATPYDYVRQPYVKYYVDYNEKFCFIVLPSSIKCENQQ